MKPILAYLKLFAIQIYRSENYGLIQTNYVLGKKFWEGIWVESHAPSLLLVIWEVAICGKTWFIYDCYGSQCGRSSKKTPWVSATMVLFFLDFFAH